MVTAALLIEPRAKLPPVYCGQNAIDRAILRNVRLSSAAYHPRSSASTRRFAPLSTRGGTHRQSHRVPTPNDVAWAALRQFRRKAVIWGAKLETEQGVLDCIMLDLSLGGARLRCDCQLELGKPATLMLDKFGAFPAEVVWATASEVGVRFNEAAEKVAERFGDVMPLDRKR